MGILGIIEDSTGPDVCQTNQAYEKLAPGFRNEDEVAFGGGAVFQIQAQIARNDFPATGRIFAVHFQYPYGSARHVDFAAITQSYV